MSLEQQIFEAIQNHDKVREFGGPLTDEISDAIKANSNELVFGNVVSGFESTITGAGIAKWIKPLAFETNLNAAIDALEAAEALLREDLQAKLTNVQLNYVQGMLSGIDDSQWSATHTQITDSINWDDYSSNLALRLTKKLIDLIEYSKAAKLGGAVLFGIKSNQVEVTDQLSGVNRIRESLRKLLEVYRELSNRDQEIVVPISLKHAKNKAGNNLVSKWGTADEAVNLSRSSNLALGQPALDFDLSMFDPLNSLERRRIRRVGIQFMDVDSGTAKTTTWYPSYWDATLSDESGGTPLSSEALATKAKIDDTRFQSIYGDREPTNKTWSDNPTIGNVDPCRNWKLSVGQNSSAGKSPSQILDIILHIHLACLPK